jgi:hypothetical protein
MRVGWYSNAPHIPSGYGQMTAQVIARMKKDGHDPAVVSNFGAAAALNWGEIPVFADGLKQYSLDIFPQQLKAWGGISIGLFDSWPMIPVAPQLRELNLAWWVPIDHDPVPPGVVEFFSKSGAFAIAMTKFGEQALLKVGMPKELVAYIPHAIDTKKDFIDVGQAAREAMAIPAKAHLVVMNAANRGRLPIRKAFPENLLALTNHLKRHPDAWAYLHTEPEGISDGMNLPRYLQFINAPMDRIRWPEPMAFRNGIPTDSLKHIYAAGDILLATSMGEGFGIPTIEAQACGTPVIVSAFAGSEELAGPHSTLVSGQQQWDEFQGSYWIAPDIKQIEAGLESNYQATKAGTIDRAKVREFALAYDADLIYETHWRPLIERLAKRNAPGAPANRAERRASKRKK